MASLPGKIALHYRGPVRVQFFPEAASQAFKGMADLVKLNSSGLIELAVASGNDITDSVDILGIPLEDASGTTNNEIPVAVFTSQTELKVATGHGTASSAVTAKTLVGELYVLKYSSTDGYTCEIDTSTNGVFKITEISGDYPEGEQHGTIWGQIVEAARAFDL